MVVKIVFLFLAVMAVLAMFGRLRVPGKRHLDRLSSKRCKRCGRFRIGSGPCPCAKEKR
ncbi:hypothetical protein [Pseudoponticoccus marisrubri]|uniref:hypothetical protein n=1 Tax=Pseudoponticoccus marisrubri TaxID=1685382 RepID=UPI00196A1A07|nr:hypothetical protein [Pseudoponticoccus marisrubri]